MKYLIPCSCLFVDNYDIFLALIHDRRIMIGFISLLSSLISRSFPSDLTFESDDAKTLIEGGFGFDISQKKFHKTHPSLRLCDFRFHAHSSLPSHGIRAIFQRDNRKMTMIQKKKKNQETCLNQTTHVKSIDYIE